MDIIRAIQEKYGLEDGYSEYLKMETRDGQFSKTDIQHWIDVKDYRNIWSKGNVKEILYNVANCSWTLKIDFPNWKNEEIEYEVDIRNDTHEDIAPYQTHLIKEGILVKEDLTVVSSDDTSVKRISCYISGENQTLRGVHIWKMGELKRDGTINICSVNFRNLYLHSKNIYITSPCSTRLRGSIYKNMYNN